MISKQQKSVIRASGVMEGIRDDLHAIAGSLDSAELWRPASALKKQCSEVNRLIDGLQERLERKLLVTILGPCGAGKSTLLNALAEVDDLSKTGNDRPTTKVPVVLCRERTDGEQLASRYGAGNMEIRSSRDAEFLEHVLLIDTPDIDSTQGDRHKPLVLAAIDMSDVLICVFNAENPKKKDYADFLAPYVQRFNGESLLCVMNRCDRLDETELRDTVMPDFFSYIGTAWKKPVETVLCVSARRNLREPKWDGKAVPRHDFDEFGKLREKIFGTYNRASFVIDRRLENAESLKDYIRQEIDAEVSKDGKILAKASGRIAETENRAVAEAVSTLKTANKGQIVGVNVLLYQKLAQRWTGPVGWLIAIWGRILVFGAGIAAVFRFGNPVSQIYGVISSLKHYKESGDEVKQIGGGKKIDSALRAYRIEIMGNWPDIAELLVKGRFDKSVRKIGDVLPDNSELGSELSGIWNEAMDNAIEKASGALSGFTIQFLFNMPPVFVLGYAGWITAKAFLAGSYLPSQFFLHGFVTFCVVWLLSFFLFQGLVRVAAGADRITRKTFDEVKRLLERGRRDSSNPIDEQIGVVLGLSSFPSLKNN